MRVSDKQLGKTTLTLVPSLLNVMSSTGHLRWLPCGFHIFTFLAPADLIPGPGVTFDELKVIMTEQDRFEYAFPLWMIKHELWLWCAHFSIGSHGSLQRY